MSLWDVPVSDIRTTTTDERRRLLDFLCRLTPEEWRAPTAAPGWTVKDIALHLLDDDLTWLSIRRDGDRSGLLDMTDRERFVRLLNAKNQRFVDAGRAFSRQVICDLLGRTGEKVDALHAQCDLRSEGWVSWASSQPVPFWFNLAQEFTESWVHQQQMREAVNRVEDHADHLPEVLRTFVWALPHQLPAADADSMVVGVIIGGVSAWTLTSNAGEGWSLAERQPDNPDASLRATADAAWRWLTGAAVSPGQITVAGSPQWIDALMRVRAIIV